MTVRDVGAVHRFMNSPLPGILFIAVYAGLPWLWYSRGYTDAAILLSVTMLGAFYIGRNA